MQNPYDGQACGAIKACNITFIQAIKQFLSRYLKLPFSSNRAYFGRVLGVPQVDRSSDKTEIVNVHFTP
ncbi:MAG TPA: hypothetical protein PK011_06075, partial [Marinagarivorans sp.]|nr:hypothetical protein [Marinagarivorans sp.]